QVLPREKPAGADSAAGPPTLKTKKKRKKKKAKQAMWLGLGVACLLSAGVAALLAFGVSGGDDKPKEADIFIPPVVTFKNKAAPLPPATTIGPGASNLSLDQALAGAPSGGTIKVKPKEGGWVTPRVVLEFGKIRSNGRVTVAGEGKDVVITRRDGGPLFRLRDADSFVLKDVTLDGGGKWGPLIEIEGRARGVTFQNVKIVNARGEIVRLIGAQGEYTRPVHFEGVHFPAGTGVAFRARSVNDVCRNVEFIGCHFEGGTPGVLVASQVETVRVRECSFGNGQYGVKFGPLPTIDGDAADPVTDWQLAGWFPQDKVPSFTPDGLPNPRELSGPWKEARADSGAIHLDRLLGKKENVTAIAYAQFVADTAGNRRIFVGADDEVKVWVNGQLVLDYGGHQGFLPRDLTAVATFRKGANHIWVQVTNGASASAFSVHVGKGYSPLAAPSWKDVTIANNTFDGLSKAVLMLAPPAPGSRVQITGNRFRKVQHYPVVVAKGEGGLMPGTVLSSANTDQEPPPQRKSFDDKLAYHLIPLGG
ncbi:MAG TPA: PA14 domain-containing protein, partial [Gemmataceae bacterium]